MKILFLTPYVPSLVRVRPYNLIAGLCARGHQVTTLTLWTTEEELADAQALQKAGYTVEAVRLPRWRSLGNSLAALPSRDPLQASYSWQPELAKRLARLATMGQQKPAFEVIHVEHLRGARYGLYAQKILAGSGANLPVVWDSVDCITLLFKQAAARSQSAFGRWVTRLELGRTGRYEGWLLSQFKQVLVTSPADRQALLSLTKQVPAPQVTVLPNGVDIEYFSQEMNVIRSPNELVVSGKMSYHANVTMALHLAHDIMPLIWERRPDVKLTIVGKDPARQILALAENPNISVTGTVADIRPYLQRAAVAVAPIAYGVGIQNKVLEAMASHTPVVSTPQAVSALQAKAGQDLLVAPDARSFASAVLQLLDDPLLRQQVGQAGFQYVETYHRWSKIAERLEEVYRERNFE